MTLHATITDDQLITDLRSRGLVGPISPKFLEDYRRDREFAEAVKRMEAVPGGPEKFKRALVRIGIIPPTNQGDETLLAAWERFKAAEREMEATGVEATEEQDAPAKAKWDAADNVVFMAPATTIEGAVVKLRRSLLMLTPSRWSTEAIINDDDDVLFARSEEFDGQSQLVVDALAALAIAASDRPAGTSSPLRDVPDRVVEAWDDLRGRVARDEDWESLGSGMPGGEDLLARSDATSLKGVIAKLRCCLWSMSILPNVDCDPAALGDQPIGELDAFFESRLARADFPTECLWTAIRSLEKFEAAK